MTSNGSPEEPDLSLEAKARIDRICVAFEDEWRAGQPPRIEDYLGKESEPERSGLLRELLRLDCFYLAQQGKTPTLEQYVERFPAHRELIAQVLGTVEGSSSPHDLPPDSDHGQFFPGKVIGGRFRIVGMLGRGGMGEVYRADDLKLGQAVALKFLAPRLACDPTCLAYLRREVRLARQVAHPHVCRVYDLGEAEGRHFLSMEYVDGEDLASLLARIGKLPADKGLVVAQEIFAGLAAAHRQGILHRDLKPANVMLDSRGHVRITDFGLACPSDADEEETVLAGTPLYMAPEQLAGRPATVRADLYAAGLLLYEMFTGQRPFQADRVAELRQLREQSVPPRPSRLVDGLPPDVDQVIVDCLQPDPPERPSSALSVVARLPHADPLDAIIAAGETPPPEMVAAAHQGVGLSPLLGAVCVVVGLVLITLLSRYTTVVAQMEFKDPAVLAERAREIVWEQSGVPPSDSAYYGFDYAENRDEISPVYFWYRYHPTRLVPVFFAGSPQAPGSGNVSLSDPPPPVAGEVALRLTPEGRLVEFRAVPPAMDDDHAQTRHDNAQSPARDRQSPGANGETRDGPRAAKLTLLLRQARLVGDDDDELDPKDFTRVRSTQVGPVSSDHRMAWRGPCPQTGHTVRVEVALRNDKPVYFRVLAAGEQPLAGGRRGWSFAVLHVAIFALVLLLLIAAAMLARNNLCRGRADRKGAWRLALYVFVVSMTAWLLFTGRVNQLPHSSVVIMGLQYALIWTVGLWLFYLALEPYVRRLWPRALVAWNRVLAGRLKDPLVGRDVLVGVLGGVVTQIAWQLNLVLPYWFGLGPRYLFGPERTAFAAPLHTLLGGRYCLGELFRYQTYALAGGMGILLMLLVLRLILRRQWLAGAAYVTFSMVVWPLGVGDPVLSRITTGLTSLLVVYLATRFGLMTLVTFVFVRFLFSFPLTPDLTAWHANGTTLFPLAVIAALALYGFHIARAGHPLFRGAQVPDRTSTR